MDSCVLLHGYGFPIWPVPNDTLCLHSHSFAFQTAPSFALNSMKTLQYTKTKVREQLQQVQKELTILFSIQAFFCLVMLINKPPQGTESSTESTTPAGCVKRPKSKSGRWLEPHKESIFFAGSKGNLGNSFRWTHLYKCLNQGGMVTTACHAPAWWISTGGNCRVIVPACN